MNLEFVILEDDDCLTIEDYLNAIEKNHAIVVKMNDEIKSLKDTSVSILKKNSNNDSSEKNTSKNFNLDDDDDEYSLDDTINFYLSLLDSISDSDFKTGMISYALPPKMSYNYEIVIARICAEYLRQIKEIEELIFTEKDALTGDDLNQFKNEIIALNNRINTIKEEKKLTSDESEKVHNNLIFVPTTSGNIRVFSDLESIPSEYYEGFTELFQSIIDGSFKNVKRFVNNDKFNGMYEVKDFKIRVVFDRIGKNDYAIITAFVKKTNIDKSYLTKLEISAKSYLSFKDYLKSNLNDQEFIDKNNDYKDELFKILSKNKGKVKEKKDDLNG